MKDWKRSVWISAMWLLGGCAASDPAPELSLRLMAQPSPAQVPVRPVVAQEVGNVQAPAPAKKPLDNAAVESSETLQMPSEPAVLAYNEAGPHMDDAEAGDTSEDDEIEVDEPGVQTQPSEIEEVAKESARSPEELGEGPATEGPVEATFALCEDSVYLRQWESDFDRLWLAENSKRFRKARDRNHAMSRARSEAFVKLVFPMMASFSSDYPTVVNRDVLNWIEYFQTRGRKAMVTWLKRAEDFIPLAQPILEKRGLPRDLVYLSMIESGFSNRAKSIAAAVGAWQFIRSTGKLYSLRIDDFVDERRDPVRATEAAARYLSDLYANLGDWHLAAASYNAGEGRIRRAKRKSDEDFWGLSDAKLLPNETRNYVPKLIAALFIGKYPGVFGFEVEQGSRARRTREIPVTRTIALSDLARESAVDLGILEELNPELRVGVTPPPSASRPVYMLRVPESMSDKMTALVESVPEASMYRLVAGRVGRKESASRFAARLGIPVSEFLKANPKLGAKTLLARGQTVMFPVRLGTGQYEKLTSLSAGKSSKAKIKHASSRKCSKARGGKCSSVSRSKIKSSAREVEVQKVPRKSSLKNSRSNPRG